MNIEEYKDILLCKIKQKFGGILRGKIELFSCEFKKAFDKCLSLPNNTKKIIKCGEYEDNLIKMIFLQHPTKDGGIVITGNIKHKTLDGKETGTTPHHQS